MYNYNAIKRIYKIVPLKDHMYGYKFDVQVWTRMKPNVYCSGCNGRFCKTIEEVKAYITQCKKFMGYKDGVRSVVHFDRDNI